MCAVKCTRPNCLADVVEVLHALRRDIGQVEATFSNNESLILLIGLSANEEGLEGLHVLKRQMDNFRLDSPAPQGSTSLRFWRLYQSGITVQADELKHNTLPLRLQCILSNLDRQ
jgi:hypothetical protein